jgi:glycosyltransferase involved in cell wall biosynthesis
MLVSLIIPTRNRWPLLSRALRSALRQTWRYIELVVVDDASDDDTSSQVTRWYPSAKLVRQKTATGPSAARNAGLAASTGARILFLDDDDLLHPGHVEALVQGSDRVPGRSAVSGRWRRFETTNTGLRLGPIMSCPRDRPDSAALAEFIDPCGEGSICQHSVLWPRSVFEVVRWDETLYTNGDVDLYGRALLAGCRFHGVPAGMAYYRMHAAERVAGTPSRKALESSTRYRLKWSDLLRDHPDHDVFAKAMCNGLMSLLLSWAEYEDQALCTSRLDTAYREWGGGRYYLPNPPRSALKHGVASFALECGGLRGFKMLSRLYRLVRSDTPQSAPLATGGCEDDDAIVLASFA